MPDRHGIRPTRVAALIAGLGLLPASAVAMQQPAPTVYSIANARAEEGKLLNFWVTRSGTSLPAQRLSWRISGDVGAIAGSQSGFIDFAAGKERVALSLPTVDNSVVEPDRSIVAVLSGHVNFAVARATGRILDNDTRQPPPPPPPIYSITGTQTNEGRPLTFQVTRTGANLPAQRLSWRITGDVAAITGPQSGTLDFQPNRDQASLSIPTVGNDTDEPDRSIRIILGGDARFEARSATGRIIDDDAPPPPPPRPPIYAIAGARANEGQPLTFPVTRTGANLPAQRLAWEATGNVAAIAGPKNGIVAFAANADRTALSIPTVDNEVDEPERSIAITLGGNVDFAVQRATGSILDDDLPPDNGQDTPVAPPPDNMTTPAEQPDNITGDEADNAATPPPQTAEPQPAFSIDDVTVNRGDPLIFTVRRTGSTAGSAGLAYTVDIPGYAMEVLDPLPRISFADGKAQAPLTVDYDPRCSKTVIVTLSDPQPSATIARADAMAIIAGPLDASCDGGDDGTPWWTWGIIGLAVLGALALLPRAWLRIREWIWPANLSCTIEQGPASLAAIDKPLFSPPQIAARAVIERGAIYPPDALPVTLKDLRDG